MKDNPLEVFEMKEVEGFLTTSCNEKIHPLLNRTANSAI